MQYKNLAKLVLYALYIGFNCKLFAPIRLTDEFIEELFLFSTMFFTSITPLGAFEPVILSYFT